MVVVVVVEVAEVVEVVVVVAVDVVVVNVNTVLIAIGRLPCDDHHYLKPHYLKSRVEVSHPVLQHVLPPVP